MHVCPCTSAVNCLLLVIIMLRSFWHLFIKRGGETLHSCDKKGFLAGKRLEMLDLRANTLLSKQNNRMKILHFKCRIRSRLIYLRFLFNPQNLAQLLAQEAQNVSRCLVCGHAKAMATESKSNISSPHPSSQAINKTGLPSLPRGSIAN